MNIKRVKVVKNSEVPSYWEKGIPARNSNGSFWTDGKRIYSYQLKIGERQGNTLIVYNYMANGGGVFISTTTSKHVSYAKSVADKVVNPQ